MRRVLISGYYGVQNTGDDALLAASAWGARLAFGSSLAIAATASRLPIFPGSSSIRPATPAAQRFRGEARLRRAWEAFRAQSFLFGGGSVFHTAEQLNLVRRLLDLSGGGPHLAAGVSLGPFRSVADERACARVLRRLRFVGLRDQESHEMARALAPGIESRLTFDVAPLIARLDGAPTRPAIRRGIGFALCENEGDRSDREGDLQRRERIASVLSILKSDFDEEVVFIDFNGDPQRGDLEVHADLAARARNLRIPVRRVTYDPHPLEMLRTVAGLRAIVAMRLHAAVFAFLTGVPTVMLSYHPKCVGWANQVGLPTAPQDSKTFDVRAVADQLMTAVQGQAPAPALSVAAAEERALLNFPDLSLR